MGDDGIVVVSIQNDRPEAWVRLVEEKPQARILEVLEVREGNVTPTAEHLKSLRNLAETYGLELRLHGTATESG
jgi:hypothetical protein